GVIKDELIDLKEEYGTPRRTVIVDEVVKADKLITAGDLVPDQAVVVCISHDNQICHWPVDKGLDPARGRQKDPLAVAIAANTRDTLYLFQEHGRVTIIPMHQIESGTAPGDGANVTEFGRGSASVVAGVALPGSDETTGYLFLVSRLGRVKRIALSDVVGIRGTEAVVMGLDKGDKLLTAFLTPGEDEVLLVSNKGQAIRFSEVDVRPMGLSAVGVMGMKLGPKDFLVGAGLARPRADLMIATQQGFGKRSDLSQYPKQGRYGQGVIGISLDKQSGPAIAAAVISASDRVMYLSQKRNNKTVYGRAISKVGRAQKGKELMAIRGTDKLAKMIVFSG
ncbi:MAG: DNA gyrase C-terminal beta-propeller domain-containing protein, partial [Anaerolineae bacterium]|nr:DNA gyrase C-terminal beta-propeller domain-containing protein [Anaerolineae bacterium]